ncbi:tail fiber protein [Bdellovibrio bacteriovorus]|nr:tail fiber protein [Bdellovibrio bacteriovorus]
MKTIILMSQILIALTVTASVQIAKADADFECVITEMRAFKSETIPDERMWVKADGRLMEVRNDNLTVYALIGSSYGGDGISNFAIPKLEELNINGSHYSYYMCKEGAWPGEIAMLVGTAGVVRQIAGHLNDLEIPQVVPMNQEKSFVQKSEEELAANVNSDLIIEKWTESYREWDDKYGGYKVRYQDYSRVVVPTVVLPDVQSANADQKLSTMLHMQSSVWPKEDDTLCVKGALVFSLRKFNRSDLVELPAGFPVSVNGAAKMLGHIYECR